MSYEQLFDITNSSTTGELKSVFFNEVGSVVSNSVILTYIYTALIFLIVGLLSAPNSRGRFFNIWIISIIFSVPILIIFVFMPNFAQDILILFKDLF